MCSSSRVPDGKTCFWNKYASEGNTLNIYILPCSGQLITILIVWKNCFSTSKCSFKWENCQKYRDIIINFKGKIQQVLRIPGKNLKFPNHMAGVWLDPPCRIFSPLHRKLPQVIFWGKPTIETYPEFKDMKCKIKFSIYKLNCLQEREQKCNS